MRVDRAEHERHSWWVDEIAARYELLDVWRYPIVGRADEFDAFLEVHDLQAMVAESSIVVRTLFGLRLVLGRLFGWDGSPRTGDVGARAEERAEAGGFVEIHRGERELVHRIENATVDALMHLGWVPLDEATDRWTAQLAVFARSKGRLGRTYMALIAPFRHRLVYPALMRAGRRRWEARARGG